MGKITQEDLDNYKENCKKGHMERIAGYSIEYYDKNEIVEDKVNSPSHYCSHPSGIECIDITEHYDFCVGNAIKYLWRAGLKCEDGYTNVEKEIEDLKKAVWYINRKIKHLEDIINKPKLVEQ